MEDWQRRQLIEQYDSIRQTTVTLCQSLNVEDFVTQSCEDVSPPKWHLAHTTWFFETFLLATSGSEYKVFNPHFCYLFNSYYHGIGKQFPRDKRGTLSRPTVTTIAAYREYVDTAMLNYLQTASSCELKNTINKILLGLNHEQQHQELLLMDIKHNFFMHPDFPGYQSAIMPAAKSRKMDFVYLEGGLVSIGHQEKQFCFDNELPRHQKFLHPYQFADRLVSNEEYLEFIESGGYTNPRWWLADGWAALQQHRWEAPLYWHLIDNEWYHFTLNGLQLLNLSAPVAHVSYFEADAFARFKERRLPTEEEWEHYVINQSITVQGNFLENNLLHPQTASDQSQQLFGDLWEWTSSAYHPYPGFKPLEGVEGEYNGKFMNNQKVMRGGSCITPISHIRTTYRNYFVPEKRWQFSGIRLAADA